MTALEKTNLLHRRAEARRRSRPALAPLTAVLGATAIAAFVSAVAVGAAGGFSSPRTAIASPHTVNAPTNESHFLGRWVVSHDETSAPVVPTSGGAAQGLGSFNGVSCPTSSECVAVGGDGQLNAVASVSQNGGSTWTQGALEQNEPDLNAVDCTSASICVAVGQGVTVRSGDGGKAWTSSSIPTADTTLLGVSCPSSSTCVSVGVSPSQNGPYSGQLLLSSDGGATWSVPKLPANVGALGSVDCPTSSFCVAVGASILVSNNGGATWTERTVDGGTGVLRSVSCESATKCVAVGGNPAISQVNDVAAYGVVTTDGGSQWQSTSMPTGSGTVNIVSCSTTACVATGAAHGNSPVQVLTTMSGSSWTPDSAFGSPGTAFSGLSCFSSTSCVFVGQNGTQPVWVSTASGAPVGTGSVTPNVRTQKDEVR